MSSLGRLSGGDDDIWMRWRSLVCWEDMYIVEREAETERQKREKKKEE